MDSFELNKIIGALLGAVFVIFSISIVSDAIFETHDPEKPGYIIEAAEAGESDSGDKGDAGPAPIGPMLASADVGKGEAVYKKCAVCHTDNNGGANKMGPNLWNIVNRPVASHEGFSYSGAMKEHAQGGAVWDYESLSLFLLSPKKFVKGTAMGFAGLKKDEDRANIIAYLRTKSDNPAPLPDAAAGGEEPKASE